MFKEPVTPTELMTGFVTLHLQSALPVLFQSGHPNPTSVCSHGNQGRSIFDNGLLLQLRVEASYERYLISPRFALPKSCYVGNSLFFRCGDYKFRFNASFHKLGRDFKRLRSMNRRAGC